MTDFAIPTIDGEVLQRGWKVRDQFTGFTGIIDSFAELRNGSVQVQIQPKCSDDKLDTVPDLQSFDAFQLEILERTAPSGLPAPDLPFAVDLGEKVTDPVTGVSGVITERLITRNGCCFVLITPRIHWLTGDRQRSVLVDHKQLREKPALVTQTRRSGAPSRRGIRL
jgi:hypothetical protein